MPTVTTHAGIPHASEPIAIVSAACRLPGHVGSPHKLWELLQSGGTAMSNNVPKSRFDITGHFDGSGRPGTMKALSGMFIEDIDPARFDAPFFNLTQADAIAMDPQQRQLLEVVYECFENGGVPIERVSGEQIGCFVGSYTVDYHDIQNRSPGQRMSGMTVGIGRAIMSNRISHFYNLKGPSWTIDTACSGGLLGVDMACQYIRAGKMNGAVVAAANLWLSPEHTQELGTMRAAYSPTGRCHTFDAKADGYCRAEAVNAVYLKRLSDAIKDGDPIRAVIRGTANNSDGWTPGINSPSSDAQAAVIRAAYADAGLDSSRYAETGFLECHGTGTPTGDPLEVNGAASVLAYMRIPSEPLMIGSIKGNIGHSEPGAGISGLIKAMMAVEHGWIPGNPNFVTPNPEIDFQGLRIHVAPSAVPWPKALHKYRRASVNSFGYGGSNVHVVLDNAQQFMQASEKSLMVSRPHASSYVKSNDILSQFSSRENRLPKSSAKRPQLLVFSANDQGSLKRQIEALSAHLLHPRVKIKLSDLSYTLSEHRSRLFCRAFVLGHPTKNGHASSISVDSAKFAKTRPGATRVGFVFTGQGAQWSQMGAELVNVFSETAKKVLEGLDRALQQLPVGLRPEWSLLRELTEPRSSEHLSKPEFSQPLVTAMQLIQLSVLDSWGVQAQVVVGHSSGEIAAACCAGLLSSKQAILVAYLRGLAAGKVVSAKPMGMLAVGLSKEAVQLYLDATGDEDVVIACHNSATSVTVSGPSALLAELEKVIKADGHFARVLQVDVGYHSHHMTQAARYYEDLLTKHAGLEKDNETNSSCGKEMISSVTKDLVTRRDVCEAAYWKENMVSPVRFHEACKKTISTKALAANFFIELGPSNSLRGPIEQIVKEIGLDDFTYTAASKRGPNSVHALFDAAGQAFLNNAGVSLPSVNTDESAKELAMPAIITDLPNYQWNHSTQYWHECLASKDWRFKKFPEHDLLGSKVLGTLWQNPSWTKTLRLSDVPWLRDHKIGSEILFPAAGYIAMAMEAVRQATFSTAMDQDLAHLKAKEYHYCLKNVQFSRGLVLEDNIDVNIMLLMYPLKYPGVTWWQYRIMSSTATEASSSIPSPGSWIENSSGLIRLEFDTDASLPQAPEGACTLPLTFPSRGKLWYKAMKDAGYSFGPDFQKQLAIECTEGKTSSRALITLDPPRSKWEPQSAYPLHPASLDSCIQSTLVSLHRGIRSGFDNMLLPSNIEELTISGLPWYSGEAISVTSSDGSLSNASVYEVSSEKPILNLRGISFATMEVRNSIYRSHTYAHLVWKPDIGLLDDDEQLQKALSSVGDDAQLHVQELLDLTAHKAPNLKVLELNLCPNNTESLWLSANQASRSIRAASGEFYFASNTANTVLAAQQMYSDLPGAQNTRFSVMDPSNEKFSLPPGFSEFDLVIVRHSQLSSKSELKTVAGNVCRLLVEGGFFIFYDPQLPDNLDLGERLRVESVVHELEGTGFVDIRKTACGSSIVAEVPFKRDVPIDAASVLDSKRDIFLLYFSSEESPVITQLVSKLRDNDWSLNDLYVDNEMGRGLEKLPRKSTVLVLDEISKPFLVTATEEQWIALQSVIEKECDILWVTQGSQIKPTEPLGAVGQGVFRAVRAEIPTIRLVTLDIESATIASLNTNLAAIEIGLKKLKAAKADALSFDFELAERGGQMHISRIRPDESLNQFKSPDKPPNDALEQQANPLIHPDRSYLFVGGLKGICGSLSIHLALRGAKHIAIMSRSGFQDSVSQAVAHNIRALGCSLHLVQGDVTLMEDVRRCFKEVSPLIGGIIQGAAVYKDRTFESLSHAEYHAALACKVKGSSNLHFASLDLEQPISFFTILSSISGVVGNKGQASYAGGNAFEDALAGYRRAMGLPAISIDLGPVDDIGVIQGNDALQTRFEADNWFKINEGLLRRIFDYSLLRQHPDRQQGFDPAGQAQMITGLAYPQPTDSELLRDVRFAGLGVSQGEKVLGTRGGAGQDKELQALFLLAQSNEPDRSAFLTAAVTVVGRQLTKQLRLPEAADPARQLLQYGMDSLAAVELRNWVRATLGVELTTLDIVNAASLTELCGKVIGKMAISSKG